MEKLETSSDKLKYEIVLEELAEFKKLVQGHKKLLIAIGEL
ncbi:MAG: hypothetical protein Q7S92_02055 [Candidatus Diapherotrites archaeon]|nr:hypothetical protein [Candidatus Diapherotrites archaeon]